MSSDSGLGTTFSSAAGAAAGGGAGASCLGCSSAGLGTAQPYSPLRLATVMVQGTNTAAQESECKLMPDAEHMRMPVSCVKQQSVWLIIIFQKRAERCLDQFR